jgi:hypothetical protein
MMEFMGGVFVGVCLGVIIASFCMALRDREKWPELDAAQVRVKESL